VTRQSSFFIFFNNMACYAALAMMGAIIEIFD